MHIKPLILLELWCLVSHVTPGNSAILCLCLGRDILVWLLSSGILGLGKNICTEQRWLPQPNFEYNEEVGDVCWTMLMYAYHCLSVLPPASQISAWTILPSGLVSDASEMLSPAFVSELPKTSRFLKPENGDSTVALLRQQHPRQFHLHKHVRGICKIGFAVFCLISSYDAMLVSLLSWLDFKLHQPLEGSWHSPMFLTSVSRLLIRNDWKLGLWWRLCFCGIPWSFPDAWGQQKLICNPFQCFPCISMHFHAFFIIFHVSSICLHFVSAPWTLTCFDRVFRLGWSCLARVEEWRFFGEQNEKSLSMYEKVYIKYVYIYTWFNDYWEWIMHLWHPLTPCHSSTHLCLRLRQTWTSNISPMDGLKDFLEHVECQDSSDRFVSGFRVRFSVASIHLMQL